MSSGGVSTYLFVYLKNILYFKKPDHISFYTSFIFLPGNKRKGLSWCTPFLLLESKAAQNKLLSLDIM